jgi:hypothetical protein
MRPRGTARSTRGSTAATTRRRRSRSGGSSTVRRDVVSLGRLLTLVDSSPNVITRERFLARHRQGDEWIGNRDFDRIAGEGNDALPRGVGRKELDALRDQARPVTDWVNREVAHYNKDSGEFEDDLTFGDLHETIDSIFRAFQRWCGTLRDTTVLGAVTMQPWESNFAVRWIPDDDALHEVRRLAIDREQRGLTQTKARRPTSARGARRGGSSPRASTSIALACRSSTGWRFVMPMILTGAPERRLRRVYRIDSVTPRFWQVD